MREQFLRHTAIVVQQEAALQHHSDGLVRFTVLRHRFGQGQTAVFSHEDALARHYGQGARRRFYFQGAAFYVDESVVTESETLLELLLMYAGEIDVVILDNS